MSDNKQLQNQKLDVASFVLNNQWTTSKSTDNTSYIPNGLMIALILKALREAQDNDLEIQKLQAKTEQDFDTALGGIGKNPSKGLIAMSAQSVVNAGQEQAKALISVGISSAVSAGISGLATIGAFGYSKYQSNQTDQIEEELKPLKTSRDLLEARPQGDLTAEELKPMTEKEREIFDKPFEEITDQGELVQKARLIKLHTTDEEVEALKTKVERKIQEKTKEQERFIGGGQQAFQISNQVSNVVQAATGAGGNVEKAGKDAKAAAENATAETEKTLQQMNVTSSNHYQENAHASAQQALQVADTLAQVAASQVQIRG